MKKVLIIVGLLIVAVVIGIIFFKGGTKGNYTLPEDYIRKFENHQSFVDGPDNNYYIYKNKIIEVQNNHYPVGAPKGTHERKITVYNVRGADSILTINGVYNAIKDKKGRVVLDQWD